MNHVELLDEELALLIASLTMVIQGTEKFVLQNGKKTLDFSSLKAHDDMKRLLKKLELDYC